MRRGIISIIFLLVVAACGDTAETTTTSSTTTTSTVAETTSTTATDTTGVTTDGTGALRLTIVVFGAQGFVGVTNVGNAPIRTDGHWLCQRPAYFELPGVVLEPGQRLWVAAGDGSGLTAAGNVVQIVPANTRLGNFAAGGGEIALYDSNAFSDADAIVDYVEWGRAGHGRSATAVEGGVWLADDFVVTDDTTASMEFIGNPEGVGSGNWTTAVP